MLAPTRLADVSFCDRLALNHSVNQVYAYVLTYTTVSLSVHPSVRLSLSLCPPVFRPFPRHLARPLSS